MTISRETIIKLGNKLAPAAVTFGRLRELLSEENSDLGEILHLIRLDQALTFHVIRLSNSVLFGIRGHNDSLETAVTHVGFNEIHRLVALAAMKQVCQKDLGTYRLKASRLWENSVATAAAAEVLARNAGREPGLAYSAGLLRTLGRVIIDGVAQGEVYPGEAEWPSVAEWERKTFGVSAADVTTMLLEHWRFPAELSDSVRGHFDPLADFDSNVGACVLNLACGVAARFGLDLPGETGHWEVTPAKLTLAGVSETDLEECAARARAHYVLLCSTTV